MVRTSGIGGLCLLITWATGTAARADEGPFRDLSFDQAKRTAADGGKRFVLVDFYTTWCGPCKKLDETTWKDPGVKDWLAKEAICLKIDAEKEMALADKYRINVYPTVLLAPPRRHRDRPPGRIPRREDVPGRRTRVPGGQRQPVPGPQEARRGQREQPHAADELRRELRRKAGPRTPSPSTCGASTTASSTARASRACGSRSCWVRIVQLGRTHPAALDELRKRRDAARKSLEDGKADFRTAMDFTALNQNLGEPEQTLALYDRIKGNKSLPPLVRQYLLAQSLDQLLKGKRYKEILAETDARAKVSRADRGATSR